MSMFVHIISLYITKVSAVNIEICKFLTVSCLEKGENTQKMKYLKQYSPADEKDEKFGGATVPPDEKEKCFTRSVCLRNTLSVQRYLFVLSPGAICFRNNF